MKRFLFLILFFVSTHIPQHTFGMDHNQNKPEKTEKTYDIGKEIENNIYLVLPLLCYLYKLAIHRK